MKIDHLLFWKKVKLPTWSKEKSIARSQGFLPPTAQRKMLNQKVLYADLRKKNVKDIKSKFFNSQLQKLKSVMLRLKVVGIILGILILVIFALFALYSLDLFKVQNFEVINAKDINPEQLIIIQDTLKEEKGSNMFRLSSSHISTILKAKVPAIKSVYISKVMPDKVQVEVVIENPKILLVSYQNAYLLNPEFQIIQPVELQKLNLSENDKNLYSGNYALVDSLIKEKYLSGIEKLEDRLKVDWTKVPVEEKQAIINTMVNEIKAKVSAWESDIQANPQVVKFAVPIIFLNDTNIFLDNQSNALKESGVKRIEFTYDLILKLKENKINISQAKWITDYTLEFKDQSSSRFLFLYTRSTDDQIEDLKAVIWNRKLENGRTYDFRSTTFSIY